MVDQTEQELVQQLHAAQSTFIEHIAHVASTMIGYADQIARDVTEVRAGKNPADIATHVIQSWTNCGNNIEIARLAQDAATVRQAADRIARHGATDDAPKIPGDARTRAAMIRAWDNLTDIEQARFFDDMP